MAQSMFDYIIDMASKASGGHANAGLPEQKPDKKTKPNNKKTVTDSSSENRLPTSVSYQVPLEAMTEDVFQGLSRRKNLGLEEQEDSYAALVEGLRKYKDRASKDSGKIDLTPLLLAADMANNTSFSKMYKAPKSKQDRAKEIFNMEAALGKMAGNLSKSQRDMLKSQFTQVGTNKITFPKLGKGNKGGRDLTDKRIATLSNYQALTKEAGELMEFFDAYVDDPEHIGERAMNWASSLVPGTDEKLYRSTVHQKTQAFAKSLEERVTDRDFKHIKTMLPTAFDSRTEAKSKLLNMISSIGSKYNAQVNNFGKLGYDVSPYSNIEYDSAKVATRKLLAEKSGRGSGPRSKKVKQDKSKPHRGESFAEFQKRKKGN